MTTVSTVSLTRSTARRRRRQGWGFTLIELLTVITILGLLLGILASTIGAVRLRSQVRKSQLIIGQLDAACRTFYNERDEYPLSTVTVVEGDPPSPVRYTGSQWLVRALTGYRDDDLKPGWGFRDVERGKVFGPYNDTERLEVAKIPDTTKYEFVDAFDRPILYYRYEDGYEAGHNNGPPATGPGKLETYLKGPGDDYFRKDFVLISSGPDGKYLDDHPPYQDGEWDRQCDDITNFLEQ